MEFAMQTSRLLNYKVSENQTFSIFWNRTIQQPDYITILDKSGIRKKLFVNRISKIMS